jgi:hypothetical protein
MALMSKSELAEYIKNEMADNTYISIAADAEPFTDENGNTDYEPTGWWSITKLFCADQHTIIFNYYGGGYPYCYSIDEQGDDETVEDAVNQFIRDCGDEFKYEEKFIIDKKAHNLDDTDCNSIFTRSGIVVIDYCYTNVEFMSEGRHTSRFVATSDEEIENCVRQLYRTFDRRFPISEYPNRKFAVLSIARDMGFDPAAYTKMIVETT